MENIILYIYELLTMMIAVAVAAVKRFNVARSVSRVAGWAYAVRFHVCFTHSTQTKIHRGV